MILDTFFEKADFIVFATPLKRNTHFLGPRASQNQQKTVSETCLKTCMQKSVTREVKAPKMWLQGCLQGSKMRPWSLQNSSKNRTWTPLSAKRWPHRPQRYPPDPKFNKNHQKYDQNWTENVQKFVAQQCKLTFKHIMEMHLELHCFFFCEAKFKDSVTAAGWAKPTRINLAAA